MFWLLHQLMEQVKKETERKKKSSSQSKQIKTKKGTTKKETKLQKSFNICAQDFNSHEIRKQMFTSMKFFFGAQKACFPSIWKAFKMQKQSNVIGYDVLNDNVVADVCNL